MFSWLTSPFFASQLRPEKSWKKKTQGITPFARKSNLLAMWNRGHQATAVEFDSRGLLPPSSFAWLSQVKTRPEARPACTYSGTARRRRLSVEAWRASCGKQGGEVFQSLLFHVSFERRKEKREKRQVRMLRASYPNHRSRIWSSVRTCNGSHQELQQGWIVNYE